MRGQTWSTHSVVRAQGHVVFLPICTIAQPPTASSGRRGVLSASGKCRTVRLPYSKRSTYGRRSLTTSCGVKSWDSCVSKARRPRYGAETTTLCWTPRICDASRRRRSVVRGTLSFLPATSMLIRCFCAVPGTQTVSTLAACTLTRSARGRRGLPFQFSAVILCGSWWHRVARPHRNGGCR